MKVHRQADDHETVRVIRVPHLLLDTLLQDAFVQNVFERATDLLSGGQKLVNRCAWNRAEESPPWCPASNRSRCRYIIYYNTTSRVFHMVVVTAAISATSSGCCRLSSWDIKCINGTPLCGPRRQLLE
jgi:hypothetical protein